ncbi:hypothetical protein MPSEU_000537100 [Mayamaea pseudoterrestris]|nr:hypothetical protein MPSEU_000537100 [Mayamaea pseudoterrestris]
MSTNLNYKQVSNVTRRTWDKETYEKKAQERRQAEEDQSNRRAAKSDAPAASTKLSASLPDEFVPAPKNAVKPEGSDQAYLKPRTSHADIDSKVGTAEIISSQASGTTSSASALTKDSGVTKTGVGWHCRVCDCFLKDSHTYLDHINGRKHQRKLGYSMHVERSTKDQLQETLQKLAEERQKANNSEDDETPNLQDIVKAKDEQAKQLKQEREQRRKEKKERQRMEEEKRLRKQGADEGEDDEDDEPAMDPAMAAMMGFASFGEGKK